LPVKNNQRPIAEAQEIPIDFINPNLPTLSNGRWAII
jgi:hypothetical protein